MIEYVLAGGLAAAALYLCLPVFSDLVLALRVASGAGHPGELPPPPREPTLLFLVPAHDEELLIAECLRSILGQDYPPQLRPVVVLADNCVDRTAAMAEACGAEVLERSDPQSPGKGNAIEWALGELKDRDFDALVIIDADSVVHRGFAAAVARSGPVSNCAIQCFDGLSNEGDTWLTRLAGLFVRVRYLISLKLKSAAGVAIPLTGNGVVLGRELLHTHGWSIRTATEGWELYARYALHGGHSRLCNDAVAMAQETRELSQSRTQRLRWTSGRLSVLSLTFREILCMRGITLAQRLDLIAELSSLGPVTRAAVGLMGAGLAVAAPVPQSGLLAFLLILPCVHMGVYSVLAMRGHPDKRQVLLAMLRLPWYAVWRVGVSVAALLGIRRLSRRWTRTGRH